MAMWMCIIRRQVVPVVQVARQEDQTLGQVARKVDKVPGRQVVGRKVGRKPPTVRPAEEAEEAAVSNGSQIRTACSKAARRHRRMRARREVIPAAARARKVRDNQMPTPMPPTGKAGQAERERDQLMPALATGQPARERNPPLQTLATGNKVPVARDSNHPLPTLVTGKLGQLMPARAALQGALDPARRPGVRRHNNEAVLRRATDLRPVAVRSTVRAAGAARGRRVRVDPPAVAAVVEEEGVAAVEGEEEEGEDEKLQTSNLKLQ